MELLDWDDIISPYQVTSLLPFTKYLSHLWRDLARRTNREDKYWGINLITFSKYYQLPGIWVERLFKVFDVTQTGFWNPKEFIIGMCVLFTEGFEKLAEMIFAMYDFDNDGLITKEDVVLVLSYVPLQKKDFAERIESQDEWFNITNESFGTMNSMTIKDFTDVIQNKTSNIFIYLLLYLLSKRPFCNDSIMLYEEKGVDKETKSFSNWNNQPCSNSIVYTPNKKIAAITWDSKLISPLIKNLTVDRSGKSKACETSLDSTTPRDQVNCEKHENKKDSKFKSSLRTRKIIKYQKEDYISITDKKDISEEVVSNWQYQPDHEDEEEEEDDKKDDEELENDGNDQYYITKPTRKSAQIWTEWKDSSDSENEGEGECEKQGNIIIDEYNANNNDINDDELSWDVNLFSKNVENIQHSNIEESDKYSHCGSIKDNTQNCVLNADSSPENKTKSPRSQSNKELKKRIITKDYTTDNQTKRNTEQLHEGVLYKFTQLKKWKPVYFRIILKDLYYFKSQSSPYPKGWHNWSDTYLSPLTPTWINKKTYFCFSINFPHKTKVYYCSNIDSFKAWIANLNLAISPTNWFDTYKIQRNIGKGKFGIIKLGINKRTREEVAIKILYKSNMTSPDLNLIKTEIEILKICQHPNIIKLYDVFENVDTIYIVMEYCSGGDLFSYWEKRSFKISEPRAASIIQEWSIAVFYLHSYGIVHRDLKPENIWMADTSENSQIRWMDFGLSKIIGPNEKCKEPYGTWSYVAPEVWRDIPYDKEVDVWSLGIISYLLWCGIWPFDDFNSKKEIVRKTWYDKIPKNKKMWKKLSDDSWCFVAGCLEKNPYNRMTINDVLKHEWMKKFYTVITMKRRDESNNASRFRVYASFDENHQEKGE